MIKFVFVHANCGETVFNAALFAVLYGLIYARCENGDEIYGRRALTEWQYVDAGRSWPLFTKPSMSRATLQRLFRPRGHYLG